ncbi:MAG: ATP-binding protein [Neisseria sp.]|nr:ATP-binding protein [Neisseria sp.]
MATQKVSLFSKYRNIIVSVLLFLFLTAAVLGYNYYLSVQIAKDTSAINIAARQGILTQQMAKEVMNIELFVSQLQTSTEEGAAPALPGDAAIAMSNLRQSSNLFDSTLKAFAEGGETTDDSGQTVRLARVTDADGVKSIENTQALWAPYLRLVNSFLGSAQEQQINTGSIRYAVEYARTFNNRLSSEVSDLTASLEKTTRQKAQILQYVQIGGIAIALLLFIYIVFRALRQLMKTDEELEEARQETTEIMQTVNEGLFLVDKDLTIGSQYSARLEEIIGQRNIGGKKLAEVLSKLVSSEDLEITETFIDQLYSEWVVEDLITDLNPLHRIRVEVDDFSGYFVTRFLDFKFSRVYQGERIERVLVSVADTTEAVMLEDKLAQEREQNDRQIEMLSTILNADPGLLSGFISGTKRRINEINETLRRPEKTVAAMQDKARKIYREIHSLKGESSAMNLHSFVTACEGFEEKIKDLQGKSNLTGNDFLSLTVMLDEIMNLTGLVENLNRRISGGRAAGVVAGASDAATQNVMQQYYTRFAEGIATRNNKKVTLLCQGMDDGAISAAQKDIIKDIAVQLLRNAIVHGIELPNVRSGAGKAEIGNVQLLLTRSAGNMAELTVEDDGRGIDFEAIRRKAVERGLYGEDKADELDKRQLLTLVFDSGFSTAQASSEDAGRGVGMDIIKERVQDLGGKLKVASVAGQYSRFTIAFPLA